jgi:hypothetical protein
MRYDLLIYLRKGIAMNPVKDLNKITPTTISSDTPPKSEYNLGSKSHGGAR